MKVSDIMSAGAKRFGEVHNSYFQIKNQRVCGCALGTLYLEVTNGEYHFGDIKQAAKCKLSAVKALTKILKTPLELGVTALNEDGKPYPSQTAFGCDTIGTTIEHLYENRKWSREKIAAYLAKIGY